jgi:hypothetical protein
MQPGKGYIIELSEESTLLYPDATGKEEPAAIREIFNPAGETLLSNLQFTMMIIAQLELPDGSISLNPEDVIYAFSGEECRGLAVPDKDLGGRIFMSVGSDLENGEEIHFRAWIAEYAMMLDIRESITFETLKKAGTMEQPNLLTLEGFTGADQNYSGGIVIGEPHPNPFSDFTEITCHLNTAAKIRLTIVNMKGQRMNPKISGIFEPGTHILTLSRAGLPAGMYFYRIEIINGDKTLQKAGKLIIRQ